VRTYALAWRHRDPDRGKWVDPLAANDDAVREAIEKLTRSRLRPFAAIGEHDRELVALVSSERVGRLDPDAKARRDRDKQLVSAIVPEGVVEVLESIETEVEHGHGRALRLFLERAL
jgi:hypothetical protein